MSPVTPLDAGDWVLMGPTYSLPLALRERFKDGLMRLNANCPDNDVSRDAAAYLRAVNEGASASVISARLSRIGESLDRLERTPGHDRAVTLRIAEVRGVFRELCDHFMAVG